MPTSLSFDFSMLRNKTSGLLDFEFMRFNCIFILFVCLFVFVALRPKSTAMVSSPNHTFSWASLNKQLTST